MYKALEDTIQKEFTKSKYLTKSDSRCITWSHAIIPVSQTEMSPCWSAQLKKGSLGFPDIFETICFWRAIFETICFWRAILQNHKDPQLAIKKKKSNLW